VFFAGGGFAQDDNVGRIVKAQPYTNKKAVSNFHLRQPVLII
jgi:hypothetical protein